MIPVQPQLEPSNFNIEVRTPGMQFLNRVRDPTNKQWKNNNYWTRCSQNLYSAYEGICAYTGIWVSKSSATVDHFIPKSNNPHLAYEWSNYRLSCDKANNNKSNENILDPFQIHYNWFLLDFPSLLVRPNQNILRSDHDNVERTIDTLRLNSECFIEDRMHWLKEYIHNSDFDFLKRHAPFVAYELQRQGLETQIVQMMPFT
ncbi:HNH endonuclease [Methanosarcina sp. KYL-1]|uniref:HNH endonuclease n=1 Tax=Methanosarcina sp. KYL-1 TaxID=2602068 RepID=UPI0021015374|nr:HNH endonuclease [Methanosarcina sp. KYL-1]